MEVIAYSFISKRGGITNTVFRILMGKYFVAAFCWSDIEWGNRVLAVLVSYSSVLQGLGNASTGDSDPAGQLSAVLDRPVIQETLPFRNYLGSAEVDAESGFAAVEVSEAGEVRFEANLDGSLGDPTGEPPAALLLYLDS